VRGSSEMTGQLKEALAKAGLVDMPDSWWNRIHQPFSEAELKNVVSVVDGSISQALALLKEGRNVPPPHAYVLASRLIATLVGKT
jgi:hypothetical protein